MKRGGLAMLVLLVLPQAQARAKARDVIVPVLPEGAPALVAAGDGTAWVLAQEEERYSNKVLWRLEADGEVPRQVSLPVPTAPVLLGASSRDGELWTAGHDWVAAIAPGRGARVLPLAARPVHDLAVTAPGRAVLSRARRNPGDTYSASLEVLLLRDDGGLISYTIEQFTGNSVHLDRIIPDGRGGFWARLLVRPKDGEHVSGYLHRSESGWRAWMPGGVWPDFVQAPPGLTVAGAAPAQIGGWLATGDGAGGFYTEGGGWWRADLYRITADGQARLIPREQLPPREEKSSWNGLAPAGAPGALLILTEPTRLFRFDGQRVTGDEKVPLPSWGQWWRGALATGGGQQWLAYRGLIMRREPDGWVRFSSRKMMDRVKEERWAHRREMALLIAGAILGAALSVGGGAFLLGRLSGRRTGSVALQIVQGSGAAALPTLLVLAVNPLVEPWDQYGIAAVMFMVGCLGAIGLGTIGTYAAGQWRRPAAAFAGAALGATIGIIAAIFADGGLHELLERFDLDLFTFRWAVAVGLVGFGGAVGCQLSGGPNLPRTP